MACASRLNGDRVALCFATMSNSKYRGKGRPIEVGETDAHVLYSLRLVEGVITFDGTLQTQRTLSAPSAPELA